MLPRHVPAHRPGPPAIPPWPPRVLPMKLACDVTVGVVDDSLQSLATFNTVLRPSEAVPHVPGEPS